MRPEKIRTFDAQAFYDSGGAQLAATYFNSFANNLIALSSVPDPVTPLRYGNVGVLRFRGIELEAKLVPTNKLWLTGSYSYQTNHSAGGVLNTTLTPNHTAKLGASYAFDLGSPWASSIRTTPHPTVPPCSTPLRLR